jgi:hypothetical protein
MYYDYDGIRIIPTTPKMVYCHVAMMSKQSSEIFEHDFLCNTYHRDIIYSVLESSR